MRSWHLAVLLILLVLITCGVQGAGSDSKGVVPQKPEPELSAALNLDQAIREMNFDVTYFGKPRWLWSGEDWEAHARNVSSRSDSFFDSRQMMDSMALREGWITQTQYNERQEARKREEQQDSAFIIRYYENAAAAYDRDNTGGKYDRRISDLHMRIADEYYFSFGDKYNEYRLQALEDATDADIYNVRAWDERIRVLESLGRNDEAQQVRDEMNQRVGEHALNTLFDIPLSPLTAILGVFITGFLLLLQREKLWKF